MDDLSGAVVARPGDTVILGYTRRLTMMERDLLVEHVNEQLPDLKVLVFDGVQHLVVYQPDTVVPAPPGG